MNRVALLVRCDFCSQRILIVEVFVTECNGKNALCQKVALLMDDANGITRIGDDPADAVGQPEVAVDFLQQHNSGIRGQLTAVKVGLNGLALHAGF